MDTTKAGDGDLKITIEGPEGTSPAPEVTKITEHHYKVSGFVTTGFVVFFLIYF